VRPKKPRSHITEPRGADGATGAGYGAGFFFFFFGIAFGHPLLVTRSGACLLLGFFRHVQTTSQHDTAFSIPKNIIRKSVGTAAGSNSLFLDSNSLLLRKTSLFGCVGNFVASL
jgi:hypothetical protein